MGVALLPSVVLPKAQQVQPPLSVFPSVPERPAGIMAVGEVVGLVTKIPIAPKTFSARLTNVCPVAWGRNAEMTDAAVSVVNVKLAKPVIPIPTCVFPPL